MSRIVNRALGSAGFALCLSALPAAAQQGGCDTAGLELPDGFCATEYASDAGTPRHIAAADNGALYINLANEIDGNGLMALRDTDGDGVADERATFGEGGGTGLVFNDGWLYAATVTDIYRYKIGDDLKPTGEREHIVQGLPQQSSHAARGLAIGGGQLFVNNGAPSNACQTEARTPGSEGQDPCPQLDSHGGIWAFAADETGQTFEPNTEYATGLRNTFALAWDDGQLYGVMHGRDQLGSLWPDRYTSEESAHLPAEELFAISEGDNFGWPYCYYNPDGEQKALAPEYGGNGSEVGRCDQFEQPQAAYPAHWAPMAMHFYQGEAFGPDYADGAFIAFHGSWNRAPSPQAGYRVIFQPFENGEATADYQNFADEPGFTGEQSLQSPGSADHRPAGLAEDSDGALYISDDAGGTIFKVTRPGEA